MTKYPATHTSTWARNYSVGEHNYIQNWFGISTHNIGNAHKISLQSDKQMDQVINLPGTPV